MNIALVIGGSTLGAVGILGLIIWLVVKNLRDDDTPHLACFHNIYIVCCKKSANQCSTEMSMLISYHYDPSY